MTGKLPSQSVANSRIALRSAIVNIIALFLTSIELTLIACAPTTQRSVDLSKTLLCTKNGTGLMSLLLQWQEAMSAPIKLKDIVELLHLN